jgi:hypothetical protein
VKEYVAARNKPDKAIKSVVNTFSLAQKTSVLQETGRRQTENSYITSQALIYEC